MALSRLIYAKVHDQQVMHLSRGIQTLAFVLTDEIAHVRKKTLRPFAAERINQLSAHMFTGWN